MSIQKIAVQKQITVHLNFTVHGQCPLHKLNEVKLQAISISFTIICFFDLFIIACWTINFIIKCLCFCLWQNVFKKSYSWFHYVKFYISPLRICVEFIVLQGFKRKARDFGGGTVLCGNCSAFAQYFILVWVKGRALSLQATMAKQNDSGRCPGYNLPMLVLPLTLISSPTEEFFSCYYSYVRLVSV